MRPQTTVLQDFHWLMLDDNNHDDVPQQVQHSEPLSWHVKSMHPSDHMPARFHHQVA